MFVQPPQAPENSLSAELEMQYMGRKKQAYYLSDEDDTLAAFPFPVVESGHNFELGDFYKAVMGKGWDPQEHKQCRIASDLSVFEFSSRDRITGRDFM